MADHELEGNIKLVGFDLDGQEMIIAKKLIGNYAEKIRRFQEYNEIKLEMKTHLKGKIQHFEIKGHAAFDGELATAEAQGLNPFVLISEILEKILNEIKHKSVRK